MKQPLSYNMTNVCCFKLDRQNKQTFHFHFAQKISLLVSKKKTIVGGQVEVGRDMEMRWR